MELGLNFFPFLGICLEAFLFGELFVLQLREPCLKRYKITVYQASIQAYLRGNCVIMHPKTGPAITNSFSMDFVSYMSYLQLSLLLRPWIIVFPPL